MRFIYYCLNCPKLYLTCTNCPIILTLIDWTNHPILIVLKGGVIVKNNIATIRESKGISQENLAKMVGVSEDWMKRVEKGNRRTGTKLLEKIAENLNVSMKDIFLD